MEENKRTEKKENSLKKILDGLDVKKLLRICTIFITLAIIVFMTITNLGLNDNINWLDWFGNVMILVGISIAFLVFGESGGYDKQKNKKDGLFQNTLIKLENFLETVIKPIKIYFGQWFNWYQPIELENKKIDFLISYGVDSVKAKRIVKCCTLKDLSTLKNETKEYQTLYNENEKYVIRQLEEYEILPVTEVLEGNIKLDVPAPGYFLSPFEDATSDRELERGKSIVKKIKANKTLKRGLKIAITIIICILWVFFTVKEFMRGDDTQAWLNLVSRLLAALTSYLSGYLTSVTTVKLESQILENKLLILQLFASATEKKIYPMFSQDELDKMALEEAERKKTRGYSTSC